MEIKTDQPILLNQHDIHNVIAHFWNKISAAWAEIWGPHIHHGYYPNDEVLTPLAAQENLIKQLTHLLDITADQHILDVGCGMGGSSLYLHKHYNAKLTGITLSQKQVDIASEEAKQQQLNDVQFKVENALEMNTIADQSIDLVWSLESCEQFCDKFAFLRQVKRVLKPGGKLMLATWCSDQPEYHGKAAKVYQQLCKAFDVPYMPTIEHYSTLIEKADLCLDSKHDWSQYVERSWDIGVSLVSGYSMLKLLKMAGWRGYQFSKQIKLMRDAFKSQRIRYGVFIASKPAA